MKRREFVKAIPLTALLPAGLAVQTGNAPGAKASAFSVNLVLVVAP